MCHYIVITEMSDVRVDDGVVQWNIISNIPVECYVFYSLELYFCTIESFTIFQELSFKEYTFAEKISGESVILGKIIVLSFNSIDY